jgi:succinate dehydrogenase / fumarate reductase cytochrome b subunit
MGFWLLIYLAIHLITNSQAALWIGDDGRGFIRLVNALEALPYLQVVETVLIGIPLAVHGIWGVKRALSAKLNAGSTDGSSPSFPYGRNRAFVWQRMTSWILLFGIIGHVAQMRFLDAPKKAKDSLGEERYFTRVSIDEGLGTLAERLHVTIYEPEEIVALDNSDWIPVLSSFRLKDDQVVAMSSMPGTAFLLMVRDTFKSPLMAVLYTVFLLAAAFHAFNGFWTFLIAWGVILSYRSQKAMLPVGMIGMLVLSLLGLAAIWCSYWINLRN